MQRARHRRPCAPGQTERSTLARLRAGQLKVVREGPERRRFGDMTHRGIIGPLEFSGIQLRRWALIGLSAVGLAGTFSIFAAAGGSPGFDTFAYWLTGHGPLYAVRDGFGAFQYTPAALFFLWPVSLLPWPLAFPVWLVISTAALVVLGRWWALALLVFLPVPIELFEGNIHLLLALAIVIGFRHPAAWAFVLVTKTTPGIGLLWFAVRREWRLLAVALAATALLLAASLLIPGAWTAWDIVVEKLLALYRSLVVK